MNTSKGLRHTLLYAGLLSLVLGAWGTIACIPAQPDFACLRCADRCPGDFVCSDDGYCLPKGKTSDFCGVAPKEKTTEDAKEVPADHAKDAGLPEPRPEPPADAGPDKAPDLAPDLAADKAPDLLADQGPDTSSKEPSADEPATDAGPDRVTDTPSGEPLADASGADTPKEAPPELTECQRKDGQPCDVGKGECKQSGTYICANDVLRCDATPKTPTPELCDGKDNDCDGNIDNKPNSSDALTRPCYKGNGGCTLQNGSYNCKGLCATGSQTCQNANWQACTGEVGPKTETCDGKDEDCDGSIDNGLTCVCKPGTSEACYPASAGCTKQGTSFSCKAPCKTGTRSCDNKGAWGNCIGAVIPVAEVCDGKDNDCDGQIDETFSVKGNNCGVGTGNCQRMGTFVCTSDGKGTECNAKPGTPSREVCDGKDNDCDGQVDEGLLRTFYRDYDNDSFGDPRVTKKACNAPSGYVSNRTDCYDRNINARPGQTAYFGTHRGDGSFDYDCDGGFKREPVSCNNCSGNKWKNNDVKCGNNQPIKKCKRISGVCISDNNGNKLMKCR